ncbi:hypothetical protein [Polyangium mundeleinium]|uniref:Uncharacterized protein n=1 Tax=Polyangium mundeleinium TaxID=2995306 RepID=A0ABT5ER29_9BACT|nr:hypothetical protein [Polyangium mundeleinium]MDC0744286.1 hypothetical protein [Polyangium mundeleinium]
MADEGVEDVVDVLSEDVVDVDEEELLSEELVLLSDLDDDLLLGEL